MWGKKEAKTLELCYFLKINMKRYNNVSFWIQAYILFVPSVAFS